MQNPAGTYHSRSQLCFSAMGKRIFELLESKRTNLALSADVTSSEKLIHLADTIGPEICILKTHIDIINDFTPSLITELKRLAAQHSFFIFEDRKFADIGNTVKHQYLDGIYQIASWADIVNAHSVPGPSVIKGLADVGLQLDRGLLMIAEMSSKNNLMDEAYAANTLMMAEQFSDFVIGFITQHPPSNNPRWINMTPGVQYANQSDSLDQQYITPEQAILENGTDIIIVGRGITAAADPISESRLYRQNAWSAYEKRISNKI